MKVVNSGLQLQAAHSYSEKQVRREQVQVWVGERSRVISAEDDRLMSAEALSSAALFDRQQRLIEDVDRLRLSAQAQSLSPSKALLGEAEAAAEDEPIHDFRISLIKALVERFSGREIELMKPSDLEPKVEPMAVPSQGEGAEVAGAEASEGWGLVYDYYESYEEQESTHFQASGKVLTADGEEIAIDIELGMSRSFQSEIQINLRAGDALKDPLVVNYAGNAAELTQRRFDFDLDLDGRLDQMAVLRSGSAYLALDRNQDGRINDGSELFGPTSGSGFAELAEHDGDSNGWIDENDAIYQRLRLWSREEDGSDRLIGLGQAGIGAVYLGHVETPFLLKDAENNLQGKISDTGLFLREDGSSGTVQELDLVV